MTIIGEGFSRWMKKQVEVRQRTLGSGLTGGPRNISNTTTTPDSITPFLNASPWIRMASSVNLATFDDNQKNESNVPKDIKTILEILTENPDFNSIKYNLSGDGLAKSFVLHNGVTPVGGTQYSGITKPGPINVGNIFGGAYGFGTAEVLQENQGYVPQPGITSANFKYLNNGALSKAEVKIKAFSQFQFQIIDILFQRPGYTVLLEFGHTTFLDNDGNTQYAGQGDYATTNPFEIMFQGPIEQYKIASAIQKEKQKWYGNYEGNFMKITKFSWNFNADGTYDITCNLVGVGDVINSLKVNISPNSKLETKATGDGSGLDKEDRKDAGEDGVLIVSEAITSRLNYALYRVYLLCQIKSGSATGYGWLSSLYNTVTQYGNNLNAMDATVESFPIPAFDILEEDGSITPYDPKTDQNNPNRIFTGFKDKNIGLKIPKGILNITNTKSTTGGTYNPQTYITFGHLLALLVTNCNLVDGAGNPLTFFNFNFENLNEDINYMKTFPGHFSSDPNICLIPPSIMKKEIYGPPEKGADLECKAYERQKDLFGNDLVEALNEIESGFKVKNSETKGRLACVYLDINFVASILKNNQNKEESTIAMVDFLNGILSGINEATGGINNFRILFNEDTYMIDIISEVPMDTDGDLTQPELTTINTFGLSSGEGSFVTKLDLKAELTDKFATQISVGAQSNGNTLGTNAGSFSLYNYGLIDRIIPVKKVKKENEKAKGKPDLTDTVEPSKDPIGDVWTEDIQEIFEDVYDEMEFTSENVSALKNINSDYCNLVLGMMAAGGKVNGAPAAAAPFFLPFNLGLTMHGISGLRIFQGFKQDGKMMPYSYDNNKVKIIITSYSHDVSIDGWKTSVDTAVKPLFGDVEKTKPNPKRDRVPNQSPSAGSTPVSEGTSELPPDPEGTITSNYPLNQIYYPGPTNKSQIYIHHTAGRQNIKNEIAGWNNRTDHVATHYITNNAGEREQLFADEAYANHLGLKGSTFTKYGLPYKNLNKTSLAIELQAAGGLTIQPDGTYKTWFKQTLPPSKVARPVDANNNPISYKGFEYYEKYTNVHIANIKNIIQGWMSKYNIPYTFNYNELFMLNKVPLTGKKGIYTHNSVRTDKFDVFPQLELINMLKSIQT